PLIGKAVKAGVIALIVMNAAWAAAFGMIYFALLIVLLLPVSLLLGKLFAVT
ncbi:MAG TPA: polyprenyltransferase, partial [Cyclobacteriaceae bacterium]|nr:polyprenyltransferase [Cyclobacteriaceae bacterium]